MAQGKDLINRDSLERIIKRAAELQASERDIGDGLTDGEVLQLGAEVGIPKRHLQLAILEERSRLVTPAPHGVGPWLVGQTVIAAERVVPGTTNEVEAQLDAWLTAEEGVSTTRRGRGHLRWERQSGVIADLRISLGVGGRPYTLARATHVEADIIALEDGYCHVRIVASVEQQRARRIAGAGTMIGTGIAASAIMLALGFAPIVIGLPAVVAAGVSLPVLRRHRFEARRIRTALERVLDRLERGESPTHSQPRRGALERVADEIRKALGP